MSKVIDDIYEIMMDWEDQYEEDSVGDNNLQYKYPQIEQEFINLVTNDAQLIHHVLNLMNQASNYKITKSYEVPPIYDNLALRKKRHKYYAESVYNTFKASTAALSDKDIINICKTQF